MRMTSLGRIYLAGGEEVFRDPGLWDKLRYFLGSDVDLRTGQIQVTRSVLRLTEQLQRGLEVAGVTNAVSLVVDTDVVFQDTAGVDDDAEVLVEAMRAGHERFTKGFETLRILFEVDTEGLHSLVEVTVRATHDSGTPAASVAIGARVTELRPRQEESIEAARERIGQRLGDPKLIPTYRQLLANLSNDLLAGMKAHFPRSQVEFDPATVQVVRPSAAAVRHMGESRETRSASLRDSPVYPRSGFYGPYYDPWDTYYDDPMDTYLNLLVLDAMMTPKPTWGYEAGHLGQCWSDRGAPVHVMSHQGAPICDGDQLLDYQDRFSGVSDIVAMDLDSAQWDDEAANLYAVEETSWSGYGGDSGGTTFDCAGYDSSTSSSWDCSSDCSWDCSSDCSWDCSSDCSWD
ncbi:MAG: hypothetical protein CMH53_10355 [Myxococcales bacterium]|nr:hypothetical protein [Myxococcales bacterium]